MTIFQSVAGLVKAGLRSI